VAQQAAVADAAVRPEIAGILERAFVRSVIAVYYPAAEAAAGSLRLAVRLRRRPRLTAQADARPRALRRDFSRMLKGSPNCLISKNLVFA
jgi:hypothetical protein